MNSVNSSLLESESVFLQLDDIKKSSNSLGNKSDLENVLSNNQYISGGEYPDPLLIRPIQMTHEEAMRLLNIAASLLQAHIKRFFQQRRYQKMLKEHNAATKIQAAWRGYHTRYLNMKIFYKKHKYITNKSQQHILEIRKTFHNKVSVMMKQQTVLLDTLTKTLCENHIYTASYNS